MTVIDGRADASGPLTGLANMLGHPFITHALVAGSAVAVVCGLVGYFLVLRAQVFAGDALGHVAYTGAMAALVFGLDPRVGLFAVTILAGVALGGVSRRGADDVVIGSFFSWVLGLGALFLTYYTTHGSGNNGTANVNVLFGSIFGINDQARTLAIAVAVGVGAVMIAIARPLLFATIDPAVAAAAAVPTRLLGTLFLAIVGATVAEATQIIGALVVLGLLAAPAAAAARLTTRPWHGFWLSAVLATAAIWVGVTLAYLIPAAPASFTIMITAAAMYLFAGIVSRKERSDARGTGTPAASPTNR
jgi:zinc/manganese transport system permease protein